MQSRPPVALAVFQVPNSADEGTAHRIDQRRVPGKVFDLTIRPPAPPAAGLDRAYGPTPPTKQTLIGAWTVYRQVATQGSTTYTILDGARDFPQPERRRRGAPSRLGRTSPRTPPATTLTC